MRKIKKIWIGSDLPKKSIKYMTKFSCEECAQQFLLSLATSFPMQKPSCHFIVENFVNIVYNVVHGTIVRLPNVYESIRKFFVQYLPPSDNESTKTNQKKKKLNTVAKLQLHQFFQIVRFSPN